MSMTIWRVLRLLTLRFFDGFYSQKTMTVPYTVNLVSNLPIRCRANSAFLWKICSKCHKYQYPDFVVLIDSIFLKRKYIHDLKFYRRAKIRSIYLTWTFFIKLKKPFPIWQKKIIFWAIFGLNTWEIRKWTCSLLKAIEWK